MLGRSSKPQPGWACSVVLGNFRVLNAFQLNNILNLQQVYQGVPLTVSQGAPQPANGVT